MKHQTLEQATAALVAAATNVLAAVPVDARTEKFSQRLSELRGAAWEARVTLSRTKKAKVTEKAR